MFNNSNALRLEANKRVSLSLRNLSVSVKNKDSKAGTTTNILNNVSFDLPASNIMAIMGGSGAGKTTLLNVLAQTINIHNRSLDFSGSVHYNDQTGKESRIATAFMQQNDVFLPGLTLRETLDYQAQLRIPHLSSYERLELITSLLLLLELDVRANEMVMTFTGTIRLSGGEQRRASLAIQLLSKPQLLFLDEPTTGLDTTSALTLVSVLRKLASPEIGITIVLLIHQPRAEIVEMFDKLCVLARGGRTVYYGSLSESVEYFSELQSKAIIADVHSASGAFAVINKIMALLVKNSISEKKEIESSKLVSSLVAQWDVRHSYVLEITPKEQNKHFVSNLEIFKAKRPLSFHKEVCILTKRSFIISIRDKVSLITLIGGTMALAVIIGWMFYKPNPNLAGIRSITSYLYAVLEVVGFGPIPMEIQRLWTHEGVFFIREYKEKYVTAPGFIVSRRLSKFFIEDIPILIIFSAIAYFMGGLRLGQNYNDTGDASFFGVFFAITLLVELVAMSTAMLFFFWGSSFATSSLYINLLYQIQNSGSGYFVNSKTMPVYVRWVKYVAYFWYGFGALNSNQYTNWEGNCSYPSGDDRCIQFSGNYQLELLGYPENWIAAPIGYLIAWFVGFNIITLIVVKTKNFDVTVAKQRKNRIKGNEELKPEEVLSSSTLCSEKKSINTEGVSISVRNVDLAVKLNDLRFLMGKKSLRTLLHGINAHFQANGVNVIMGPSGGGKTTFLNFLASRLPRTSSFSSTGQIVLNGRQEVSTKDISYISAYVTQYDNLLIPHLTVRETLYYQALLRLPLEEHEYIASYIKTLLRKTGLLDCADTPVGSITVKGISGGEKRRVSIAIQLLSRPKVLFLDEPTSGLDLATSASILALLKELAEEGTTIITSIHQPSKELFANFDSMVLLARGGYVVYNGPTSSVGQYLKNMGYTCPDHVSIADYVLDAVSVQVSETREISQARVEHLISSWSSCDLANKYQGVVGSEVDLAKFSKHSASVKVALSAVSRRQFLISRRSTDVVIARVSQVLFLAAVYALFFAPLKNNQDGITNRFGLVQSVLNLYFCGLVNNISLYPSERDVFHQEYKDGNYSPAIFSVAYFFVELPFEVIPSVIFSVLVVFGIGLPRTAGMFFAVFWSAVVCLNTGESLGMIFNSLISHISAATNILANLFMVVIFMAGTMSLQMPSLFRALNYLSPIKYVMQIMVNMSFKNQDFSCGDAADCIMNTGAAVLEEYNLSARIGPAFGALTACFIIYRMIAFSFIYARAIWFV